MEIEFKKKYKEFIIEPEYWVFIVSKSSLVSKKDTPQIIYDTRMKEKFWGISKFKKNGDKNSYVSKIKKGDYVAFYQCSPIKKFIGTAKLASSLETLKLEDLKRLSHDAIFKTSQYGVWLESPKECNPPIPLSETNFKPRQGSIHRLTKNGFLEITKEELSKAKKKPDPRPPSKEKINISITRRQGQPRFRKTALSDYNGKCAITGTSTEQVLEAAHIVPYSNKDGVNEPYNGILLRSDIHLLFDKNLIQIDHKTLRVSIAKELLNTEYKKYNKKLLKLVHEKSKESLKKRSEIFK